MEGAQGRAGRPSLRPREAACKSEPAPSFWKSAWKKRPQPVEKFLMEWKDKSPRLIFQYATEKMAAGARARFRRAKTKSA